MIEFFNNFSEEELVSFNDFINSKYFNSNKSIINLFNYLKSLYPDIKEEDYTKKKLSAVIYSEKKVNDVKIRKLISDFCKITERFFLQVESEKNETANRIILLKALRDRKMYKRYEMEMNSLVKEQREVYSKNDGYYLNQINILTEKYYYEENNFKLKFAECLQEKSDNLDYYFVLNKLHSFHEMLDNEPGKDRVFDKKFLNEINSFVQNNLEVISNEHPKIYIIYLVVKMNMTFEDKYLNKLINYLKNNESKFTHESLCYYYHYVRAYYVKKLNRGEKGSLKNAFQILKLMKEKNLFLIEGRITDSEFNSVVNILLPMKEYKWIDEFIEEYKKYLDSPFSKDAYNLAKARLYYGKKDYAEIFRHLNKLDYKEPFYYYNSKFILGRVYFETGDYKALKYILDNLRQYVRLKNNMTSEQITAIKMYVKYVSSLIKITETSGPESNVLKLVLKKELDMEKSIVPNKNWFYEKLSGL